LDPRHLPAARAAVSFGNTALVALLGVETSVDQDDMLNRCHDNMRPLKEELLVHLHQGSNYLFDVTFDLPA